MTRAGTALPPARADACDSSARRAASPVAPPSPRRRLRLRLADLMRQVPALADDRCLLAARRRHWTSPASPPTAGGWRPAICSPRCPAAAPTAAPSSPMRWRAARSQCWRRRARPGRPACRRGRCSRTRAAPASGADRRGAGRPAAGDRGRGHRHQRQDQHGRVPAPDLGRRRQAGRQPGHARPDRAGVRPRAGPDHARSGQPGGDAGRPGARRRAARRDGGVLARAGPVPAGRRAPGRRGVHQPDARPSGLSRHRWTPTAPPSCACSTSCCPHGAPAVASSRHGCRDAGGAARHRARGGGCDLRTVGEARRPRSACCAARRGRTARC